MKTRIPYCTMYERHTKGNTESKFMVVLCQKDDFGRTELQYCNCRLRKIQQVADFSLRVLFRPIVTICTAANQGLKMA